MREKQHTVRRARYRMDMLGFAFLAVAVGLLFSDESFAVTKSAITVEFIVDDDLLDYEPSENFKNSLSKYTCGIARKHWGFLDWCCETDGCNRGRDELVWTVKLKAEDETGSLTSWHVDHFVNSSKIDPDRFAQDELFKSISQKPVTSDLATRNLLLLTIARQIGKQFKLEAFRQKATNLLLQAPVAHELETFEDNLNRTVLTLPFRYCDLELKKEGDGDDIPTFTVSLNFNNGDTNRFVLEKTGLVDPRPDRQEDKKLTGFIKGKVIESDLNSLEANPDLPLTNINNTIFSELIEKVENVYMKSYAHDPGVECSVSEDLLVIADPGNVDLPPQGGQP